MFTSDLPWWHMTLISWHLSFWGCKRWILVIVWQILLKTKIMQTSSYTYFEDKLQWLLHKHSVCNLVTVYNNPIWFNQNGLQRKHKFHFHIFMNLKKKKEKIIDNIKWDKLNSIWSLKDLDLKCKTSLLRFSCPTWALAEHITTDPHSKQKMQVKKDKNSTLI